MAALPHPELMEEKEADRPADAADTAIMDLSYTLDASNAIIAVSGDWDRVALDNGGEQIISRRIIGRRLDDFITGDVTLMFVRTMLMSARTLKYVIRRPYRCDSPQLKRSMEMTIVPRAQGVLEVCHRQLRSEPYRYPLAFKSTASGAAANFIKRCSICNRVRVGQTWSEVDDAVRAGRLPRDAGATLMVVYGVCPECMARRGIGA
ncbi:MAG: hypothetical protein IPN78_08210 [Candidatus Accumulibacter sp.]|nr:hypothetical protein [Candidatus Accumulibacter propinquus]